MLNSIKQFIKGFFDTNKYVLVKDNDEILCKFIEYYDDMTIYKSYYTTKKFSSKEDVISYNYFEAKYMRSGYNGESVIIFHSKESAYNFLEEKINNKSDYRILSIGELNLPDNNKVIV